MTTATLLVELLTEELPPKALKDLGEAFARGLVAGLHERRFLQDDSVATAFASPRRLAVSISFVLARSPDRPMKEKLMPASVGIDADGKPTAALRKRLAKLGREALADRWPNAVDGPDRIESEGEGKNAALVFRTLASGRELSFGLQSALDDALAKLPIPKCMSYQLYDKQGGESTVQFVRPVHKLLALHGSDVIGVIALGLAAGREAGGHRFMGRRFVTMGHANDYALLLHDEGKVVASFAERRDAIRTALLHAAGDDAVLMPDALLDEVTALVEWPMVYGGTFDERFLDVPQECLILTMQQNQKYFALTDLSGAMVNRFLLVSNIETADPSAIIGGNERVLRARLADAKFFYDQDRKKTLESRVEGLKTVVYHNKLGSQYERMQRVEAIAGRIADTLGYDANDARRAARIGKADLLTDMVGEFPELQGLMGRYYATRDGEKPDVAAAIEEQYRPRFAGDALPASETGTALALADKLETMAGMFGIRALATGDKDPFALRRHALGVVRMLVEKRLPVSLVKLVGAAIEVMPIEARGDCAEIVHFILERARSYFIDRGFALTAIESVLNPMGGGTALYIIDAIVPEASNFIATDEGRKLAEANKRITNILKKSAGDHEIPFGMSPRALPKRPNAALFTDDAEHSFWNALREIGEASLALRENHRFAESLRALSALAEPTAAFFDNVMVNADDPAIRDNRITLLQHARAYMNQVAELSTMAG